MFRSSLHLKLECFWTPWGCMPTVHFALLLFYALCTDSLHHEDGIDWLNGYSFSQILTGKLSICINIRVNRTQLSPRWPRSHYRQITSIISLCQALENKRSAWSINFCVLQFICKGYVCHSAHGTSKKVQMWT